MKWDDIPQVSYAGLGPTLEVKGFPLTATRRPVSRAEMADAAIAITQGRRPDWLGTWSVVVRDAKGLAIATDDFGTRPLFHRSQLASPTASNTIWPLIPSSFSLDPIALADFILIGHFIATRTAFEDVAACPPAALVRVDERRIVVEQNPPITTPKSLGFETQLDRLLEGYEHIPTLGVPLSGGLDSRVLLGSAVDAGFDTYSWTFTEVSHSEEETIAAHVAREANVPHMILRAKPGGFDSLQQFVERTSGQLSLEHAHGIEYYPVPPQRYTVVANGVGAGLIKGTFSLPPDTPTSAVPGLRIKQLLQGRELSDLQRYAPGVPEWTEWIRDTMSGWLQVTGSGPRDSDWTIALNRPTRFNVWGPMAAIPTRDFIVPFLDRELIAAGHAIPEEEYRSGYRYRKYIEQRWPTLSAVPWVDTGLPIPRNPSWLRRVSRATRRRTRFGRPVTFSDERIWYRSLQPTIKSPMEFGVQVLEENGIDCRRLLSDHTAATRVGRAYRLRIATIGATLQLARRRHN